MAHADSRQNKNNQRNTVVATASVGLFSFSGFFFSLAETCRALSKD
ncbi:MAG: hypothetical protein KDJ65_33995 [Anaerolineae bacterium]|nr:hypothetical protein [Anaerolineae bacterium]